MNPRTGRAASRDLHVRRQLRRPLICACVLGTIALVALALGAVLNAVAHAREQSFARHAVSAQATIEDNGGKPFADWDLGNDPVPVVFNHSWSWSSGDYDAILVNENDPSDVRVASETRAFLGSLYDVQEAAVAVGVVFGVVALAFGSVWFFKWSILSSHPWRSIEVRPGGRPHWFVSPGDRSRFRSWSLPPECREVEIAGPLEPAPGTYSVVRLDNSPKLRVVRGPRYPVEGLVEAPGPA
jgi:hypothetical protein